MGESKVVKSLVVSRETTQVSVAGGCWGAGEWGWEGRSEEWVGPDPERLMGSSEEV